MSTPSFIGGLLAVLAGTDAIASVASEPRVLCETCNRLILWDFRQVVDSTYRAVVQSVRTPACRGRNHGFSVGSRPEATEKFFS
jgi:hypothetical protein